MKKIIFFLVLLLSFTFFFSLSAKDGDVKLQWNMAVDTRLEFVRTANVKLFVNNYTKRNYNERNIIDLTCYKNNNKQNFLKGVFSLYEKDLSEYVFKLKNKYSVDFAIAKNGKYIVASKDYMPNLRNIPVFPEYKINQGSVWKANAVMIIDSFSRPFKLTFPVKYKLKSFELHNGKEVAVIDYSFVLKNNLPARAFPSDFPTGILAVNKGRILWSIKDSVPVSFKDNYRIIFSYYGKKTSVRRIEFRMNILTKPKVYKIVRDDDKIKKRDELRDKFSKDKGIDIDSNKQGLVVRMGDILFDFNSDKLKLKTKAVLDKLAKIIKKKYPDREIIIEGYTDSIGTTTFNKKLSEKRSKSVAKYLKNKKIGHDKLSYRGMGEKNPIGDNKTLKGRKKNRRVELIIKLN